VHAPAISTVDKFNGADLGIREEWIPLFDKYGVDLVVCGHEHLYERSHPIRGWQSPPIYVKEDARWSAIRNAAQAPWAHVIAAGRVRSIGRADVRFEY
jgi:hypothetical protein